MKILMIGWGLPPKTGGGLDTYAMKICKELSDDNDVHLTIPEFNMPDDIEDIGNTCIIPIKSENDKKSGLVEKVLDYNKKIHENLINEKYDVIHVNDWFGTIAANRIKEINKTPVVFVMHSTENMRLGVDENVRNDIYFLELMGLRIADKVIAVSGIMKNEIMKNYGIEKDKISVIHNGYYAAEKTSDAAFLKKKYGIKNKKIVLYLGRLSGQKGVEYLIYAAKKVLKKRKDVIFIIAGFGHLSGRLKKMAKIFSIENDVIFTGRAEHENITSYYASADIFVSPSIWEPFGITITEAMGEGVPVIATPRTGATENMEEGKDYTGIRNRNSDDIANSIIMLLEDDAKRKSVGRNGHIYCKDNFSWKKCAAKTSEIYNML